MDLQGFLPLSWARREELKGLTMADYTDPVGFIGRRESTGIDCGDGLQRSGLLVVGDMLTTSNLEESCRKGLAQLLLHKIGHAQYVRRPGPQLWWPEETQWMGRINNMTGDQLRPLIIALGLLHREGVKEARPEILSLLWALFKRGGFYWNTRDTGRSRENTPKKPGFSGPEHLNIFLRALLPRSNFFTKLLLLPGDLVGLLSTLSATFYLAKQGPFKVDQVNRMLTLLQGLLINPTPISKLSHYIFCKYRPTWDVYVDKNWVRVARENRNLNPGLYVFDTYFWHPTDPPFESGPWRALCITHFRRPK
jgi:hypothetical protein